VINKEKDPPNTKKENKKNKKTKTKAKEHHVI